MTDKKNVLPNLKGLPYGGAWAVENKIYHNAIESVIKHNTSQLAKTDSAEFLETYHKWFQSSHNISGLETFTKSTCSLGTTETFDKFYLAHSKKRLRLWKGEYFYHQIAARTIFDSFCWMHEAPIQTGDVLVVSVPFADTGNVPADLEQVLDDCDKHQVPVLIDLAYINLAKDLHIDLSRNCVQVITTSLSKVFPVAHYRIGMRLTKHIDDDLMIAYEQNQYVNKFGCGLGIQLMQQFTADHLHNSYQDQQKQLCEQLGLEVSRSVIFGVDHTDQHKIYNRGGKTNRLCFAKVWAEDN